MSNDLEQLLKDLFGEPLSRLNQFQGEQMKRLPNEFVCGHFHLSDKATGPVAQCGLSAGRSCPDVAKHPFRQIVRRAKKLLIFDQRTPVATAVKSLQG